MSRARWVPFAYGFRPFFLLSGMYAIVAMAAWLLFYSRGDSPLFPLPPQLWHGHEMIFGFIAATIAGFMLTAVPSWTGSRGFAGRPLIVLTLLWFAGRMAFFAADVLPAALLVVAELAFLPALMATIAPSLLRTFNRNSPLLAVLALFWAADAVFLYGVTSGDVLLAGTALRGALDVVLVLITVIGGRIVPSFTANALRMRGLAAGVRSHPVLERLVIAAMLVFVVADVLRPQHGLTAVIAAAAALLQLARLARWQGYRTLSDPIVWILHAAYLWLPVGLALKAAFVSGGFAWAAHWQHALSAGTAATMILAVMTRAALGHTGRPLRTGPAVTAAYVLLLGAVAVRVFGPALLPAGYLATVTTAGTLWLLAFLLYVVVYAPILLRPRVDGKAG